MKDKCNRGWVESDGKISQCKKCNPDGPCSNSEPMIVGRIFLFVIICSTLVCIAKSVLENL